jgi:hypothetical protein
VVVAADVAAAESIASTVVPSSPSATFQCRGVDKIQRIEQRGGLLRGSYTLAQAGLLYNIVLKFALHVCFNNA